MRYQETQSKSNVNIVWWKFIPVVLLLVGGLVWFLSSRGEEPLQPAFVNGSEYPYSFPFADAKQEAAFTKEAVEVESYQPVYQAGPGLKFSATVFFPEGAFSENNPHTFTWREGGYRFVPGIIVPPDSASVRAVQKSFTESKDLAYGPAGTILFGFSTKDPLLDSETRFARITGLHYWTTKASGLDPNYTLDAPLTLVGAAEGVGELQAYSPTNREIANGLKFRRGSLTVEVSKLEIAADQSRVKLRFNNASNEILEWDLSSQETFLEVDGEAIYQDPALLATEGEKPPANVYASSIPPATSEGYLVFKDFATPKQYVKIIMPDPSPDADADASLEIKFDLQRLEDVREAG